MIKNRILLMLCIVQTIGTAHAMQNGADAALTDNLRTLVVALNQVTGSLQPAQATTQQPQGPAKQKGEYRVRCRRGRCHFKGQGHMRHMGRKKQQLLTAIQKTKVAQSETPNHL